MIELIDELAVALVEPSCRAHRKWLRQRVRCPLPGCCPVRVDGDHFCPDPEGSPAFIFPVLSGAHVCVNHTRAAPIPRDVAGAYVSPVDLAAWRPSTSDKIWLRIGTVAALGDWSIHAFADDESPLRLWSTPIAWASADFIGSVIIDWRDAAPMLLTRREIICDSVELGERLDKELKATRRRITPRLPTINVAIAAAE